MNEPLDPGGTVPQAVCYVTVNSESGIDTDFSIKKDKGHKRIRLHKKCKHCHKRKRSTSGSNPPCDCTDNISKSDSPINSDTNNSSKNELKSAPVTQVPPPAPVTRQSYNQSNLAPYVIHIQKIIDSPNDGTTFHPITFGKFLKRNSFNNIVNESLKRIGRKRISLAFNNFLDANAFLKHPSIKTNNLKAFIPTYNVSRIGVIRGVLMDLTPEEVIECCNVPNGCSKILKVRRINIKQIIDGEATWKLLYQET